MAGIYDPETGKGPKNERLSCGELIEKKFRYIFITERNFKIYGEVLQIAQEYEVDLVLQGHRHVPHVWQFGDSILLYCGTSTSNKIRADDQPCFNEISIYDDKLDVNIIDSINLLISLLSSIKCNISLISIDIGLIKLLLFRAILLILQFIHNNRMMVKILSIFIISPKL